jgi:hypothetical protein
LRLSNPKYIQKTMKNSAKHQVKKGMKGNALMAKLMDVMVTMDCGEQIPDKSVLEKNTDSYGDDNP